MAFKFGAQIATLRKAKVVQRLLHFTMSFLMAEFSKFHNK